MHAHISCQARRLFPVCTLYSDVGGSIILFIERPLGAYIYLVSRVDLLLYFRPILNVFVSI